MASWRVAGSLGEADTSKPSAFRLKIDWAYWVGVVCISAYSEGMHRVGVRSSMQLRLQAPSNKCPAPAPAPAPKSKSYERIIIPSISV